MVRLVGWLVGSRGKVGWLAGLVRAVGLGGLVGSRGKVGWLVRAVGLGRFGSAEVR